MNGEDIHPAFSSEESLDIFHAQDVIGLPEKRCGIFIFQVFCQCFLSCFWKRIADFECLFKLVLIGFRFFGKNVCQMFQSFYVTGFTSEAEIIHTSQLIQN